jgi:hypothetical protein
LGYPTLLDVVSQMVSFCQGGKVQPIFTQKSSEELHSTRHLIRQKVK